MAEIARRSRQLRKHRHNLIQARHSWDSSEVADAKPMPVTDNKDKVLAASSEPAPDTLLEFAHVHLTAARDSKVALRRYLIIFFALIFGVLLLMGGIYIVIAYAGLHLWGAFLLGAGGTFTPMAIALKLARKRR